MDHINIRSKYYIIVNQSVDMNITIVVILANLPIKNVHFLNTYVRKAILALELIAFTTHGY